MTWTTIITGTAVNLHYFSALEICACDDKYKVWAISTNENNDRLLAEFDTHEEAEEFIKNLVAQLNERNLQ